MDSTVLKGMGTAGSIHITTAIQPVLAALMLAFQRAFSLKHL